MKKIIIPIITLLIIILSGCINQNKKDLWWWYFIYENKVYLNSTWIEVKWADPKTFIFLYQDWLWWEWPHTFAKDKNNVYWDFRVLFSWFDYKTLIEEKYCIRCFGEEASNKTTELLLNKKVLIIWDDTQGDRDIYNRLLRYIYTEKWVFINQRLIENWYAVEYTYKTPYKYQNKFKVAEQNARENKLWLWADNTCWGIITPVSTENINHWTKNTSHIFYTSSHHTSKFYYCETDLARQGLSPRYLKSFSSESELLNVYPWKTLHEPCR